MGKEDSKNGDDPYQDERVVQVGRGCSGAREEAWGPRAGIASGGLRAVLKIKADCPSQVRGKTLKEEKGHEKPPRRARDMCCCLE